VTLAWRFDDEDERSMLPSTRRTTEFNVPAIWLCEVANGFAVLSAAAVWRRRMASASPPCWGV
jgi:hypothetical protein